MPCRPSPSAVRGCSIVAKGLEWIVHRAGPPLLSRSLLFEAVRSEDPCDVMDTRERGSLNVLHLLEMSMLGKEPLHFLRVHRQADWCPSAPGVADRRNQYDTLPVSTFSPVSSAKQLGPRTVEQRSTTDWESIRSRASEPQPGCNTQHQLCDCYESNRHSQIRRGVLTRTTYKQ